MGQQKYDLYSIFFSKRNTYNLQAKIVCFSFSAVKGICFCQFFRKIYESLLQIKMIDRYKLAYCFVLTLLNLTSRMEIG